MTEQTDRGSQLSKRVFQRRDKRAVDLLGLNTSTDLRTGYPFVHDSHEGQGRCAGSFYQGFTVPLAQYFPWRQCLYTGLSIAIAINTAKKLSGGRGRTPPDSDIAADEG